MRHLVLLSLGFSPLRMALRSLLMLLLLTDVADVRVVSLQQRVDVSLGVVGGAARGRGGRVQLGASISLALLRKVLGMHAHMLSDVLSLVELLLLLGLLGLSVLLEAAEEASLLGTEAALRGSARTARTHVARALQAGLHLHAASRGRTKDELDVVGVEREHSLCVASERALLQLLLLSAGAVVADDGAGAALGLLLSREAHNHF